MAFPLIPALEGLQGLTLADSLIPQGAFFSSWDFFPLSLTCSPESPMMVGIFTLCRCKLLLYFSMFWVFL